MVQRIKVVMDDDQGLKYRRTLCEAFGYDCTIEHQTDHELPSIKSMKTAAVVGIAIAVILLYLAYVLAHA